MGDDKETAPSRDAASTEGHVHSGELTLDQLELAAYCGDASAIKALDAQPTVGAQTDREWAVGIQRWGPTATVRAIVALARHFTRDWEPGVGVGDLEQGLQAVEKWILCPCDKHRREAIERRVTAGGWGWMNRSAKTIPKRATMKARRAGLIAELAAEAIDEVAAPGTFPSFWSQVWACLTPMPWSKPKENTADFRAVIAGELIPWALGLPDPVAVRLAANSAQIAYRVRPKPQGLTSEASKSEKNRGNANRGREGR
jgi:hypothetical protein